MLHGALARVCLDCRGLFSREELQSRCRIPVLPPLGNLQASSWPRAGGGLGCNVLCALLPPGSAEFSRRHLYSEMMRCLACQYWVWRELFKMSRCSLSLYLSLSFSLVAVSLHFTRLPRSQVPTSHVSPPPSSTRAVLGKLAKLSQRRPGSRYRGLQGRWRDKAVGAK